jgi:hypothetical protein
MFHMLVPSMVRLAFPICDVGIVWAGLRPSAPVRVVSGLIAPVRTLELVN